MADEKSKDIKRPNRFANAYFWWQIDPEELSNQIVNYETLNIWKSARKVSSLLLLLSLTIACGMILFGENSDLIVDAIILGTLAAFVYRGHRWATLSAMTFWTFAKGYAIYSKPNGAVIQLIWWAVYMKPFFLAYNVGRNPTKPQFDPDAKEISKETA